MIIKDEIYGMVGFNDLEKRIIDTPDFQRLRRIKQMSFTNLVYPGANHTRFEHSLGTAHLSGEIAERLGLDGDTVRKARLYGLLHDIGHTAFSHEGEAVLAPRIGSHEELGARRIRDGPVADILGENYRPEEILGLAKRKEGQIVSSDIGADRMDYLKRDALNTGVAYGVIDIDRIVHTLAMEDDEMVIAEGGLEAAESLLVGRFMMFSAVYLHHTVRIATAMLGRAITLSLGDGTAAAGGFRDFCDDDALAAMSRSRAAKPYVDGLLNRRLYKEAFSSGKNDLRKWARKAEGLEEMLREKAGFDVLVDWPSPFSAPVGFRVKTAGGLRGITELSDLVRSLEKSEESRMKVLVLAPPERREEAERLIPGLLD